MVNTGAQSLVTPEIMTPVLALPLPKISFPIRTTTRRCMRRWAKVDKIFFKVLQIGIFLAIVLWPWKTAG